MFNLSTFFIDENNETPTYYKATYSINQEKKDKYELGCAVNRKNAEEQEIIDNVNNNIYNCYHNYSNEIFCVKIKTTCGEEKFHTLFLRFYDMLYFDKHNNFENLEQALASIGEIFHHKKFVNPNANDHNFMYM